LPNANLAKFSTEEFGIEVHVVSTKDRVLDGVRNVPGDIRKTWRTGDIFIGDAVDLRCGDGSVRVNEGIQNNCGGFAGFDSGDGDFQDLVRTGTETCSLEIDDGQRRFEDDPILDTGI
jgi:hypothetical protein